jgi:hypothetical protein
MIQESIRLAEQEKATLREEHLLVECVVKYKNNTGVQSNKKWMTTHVSPEDLKVVLQSGILEGRGLQAIKVLTYIPDVDDLWPETSFVYDFEYKTWRVE